MTTYTKKIVNSKFLNSTITDSKIFRQPPKIARHTTFFRTHPKKSPRPTRPDPPLGLRYKRRTLLETMALMTDDRKSSSPSSLSRAIFATVSKPPPSVIDDARPANDAAAANLLYWQLFPPKLRSDAIFFSVEVVSPRGVINWERETSNPGRWFLSTSTLKDDDRFRRWGERFERRSSELAELKVVVERFEVIWRIIFDMCSGVCGALGELIFNVSPPPLS